MEYRLSLPKEEFLRLWDLVLIARDGVRMPFHWEPAIALYRVSERSEDFSETDRPAISGDEFVGMYWHDGQIWLKPGQSYRDMQDTALHELAHHEVPHEAHGPTWRKVYGTAYALYLRECGYDWKVIANRLYTDVVWPNRNFRKIKDLDEQRLAIRKEVSGIVRHAKNKIPVLTEMGRRV